MTNGADDVDLSAEAGTGTGLLAFLSWTIAKSELVEATASALRTGCQKVMSVEADPTGIDLRTADIDGIVSRFRTRHRLDMKDRTLDQYEQRFRQSVDMYLKWLNDDPSWKPSQRRRATGTSNGPSQRPRRSSAADGPSQASPPLVDSHQQGMITYPFPIRPGLQGAITLPEDLTMREAKRIAAFVSTLAFEDLPLTLSPAATTTGGFSDPG